MSRIFEPVQEDNSRVPYPSKKSWDLRSDRVELALMRGSESERRWRTRSRVGEESPRFQFRPGRKGNGSQGSRVSEIKHRIYDQTLLNRPYCITWKGTESRTSCGRTEGKVKTGTTSKSTFPQ